MGKKRNERQASLNSYYADEIIKVLSKPMPSEIRIEPERKKSNISYAEAKKILEHTICQIKKTKLQFRNDD